MTPEGFCSNNFNANPKVEFLLNVRTFGIKIPFFFFHWLAILSFASDKNKFENLKIFKSVRLC